MIAPSNDPRWERLRKAVALEPVDKVPVCLEGVAWCARVTGMTLEEFLSDANKLHAGRDRLLQPRRQRRLRQQPHASPLRRSTSSG